MRQMLRGGVPSLVLASVLAACGPGGAGDIDGGGGGESPGVDLFRALGPEEVVAGRLGEDGPFLDHPYAGGRPGDILMKNDRVRFVIETEAPSDSYIPYAGGVVDADLVRGEGEPDYDPLAEFHPVVGLSPVEPESIEIVDDGRSGEAARVRVVGREGVLDLAEAAIGISPTPQGFTIEVEYVLEPGASALEIVTRVYNEADGPVEATAGDLGLLADGEAAPFSVPAGFDDQAMPSRPEVLGQAGEVRPWAVAVYGDHQPLELVGGNTITGILGGKGITVWLYSAGAAHLRPGEMLEARRFLALGRDVSKALEGWTRQTAGAGTVSGQVTAAGAPVAGARVSFFDPGVPLAGFAGQAITDADGRYSALLPAGVGQAVATGDGNNEAVEVPGRERLLAEGYGPSDPAPVTVAAGGEATVDLELSAPARVHLTITDADGAPIPAKITFTNEGPREAPRPILGEARPYASRGVQKVFWTGDGALDGALAPGTYTATASRGFAWEIDAQPGLDLRAGETANLSFVLVRSVDTAGTLAMDSHVHTELSPDGDVTMAERVITCAAEGLDVHVATEHDKIIDFRPLVDALGLRPVLLSIPADEVSTVQAGHHNAWPLVPDPSLPNTGAPRWWMDHMTIAEAYEAARARGAQVIQVNHGGPPSGYFGTARYDPLTGTVGKPELFTWGFDSMEVHNGKGRGGEDGLLPIWFSLLDRGHRIAPTAVSDSHKRIPEVGSGRTYVTVGNDDVATADASELVAGVLGLRTVPTTGAFVRFATADGAAGLGDDVGVDAAGEVRFALEVQAPTWMTLTTVTLLGNGEEVARWDAATTPAVTAPADASDVTWLRAEAAVAPAVDTWYVVRVDGEGDLAPVSPGLTPWAITAPIFVDADGNGRFDPPKP